MHRPHSALNLRGVFAATLALLALAACGGGGGGSTPTQQTVSRMATFEYQAATALDPAVDFATCTTKGVIFGVHLHFTWNEWDDRRGMTAVGDDLWSKSAVIPAERELRVALHDPNNCLQGDVYVAPTNLSVNGVVLNRVESVTQGTGLAFRLLTDGSVVP